MQKKNNSSTRESNTDALIKSEVADISSNIYECDEELTQEEIDELFGFAPLTEK